ncbi:ABC transporter substrate-binding protein OS=Stutzerimonas stutzeri OX=316 GN=CXK99_14075 PE=4 SV=1 [Stutzerimonas stutzeri]
MTFSPPRALAWPPPLSAGCNDKSEKTAAAGAPAAEQQTFNWKMVTSWPKNFPGVGVGAERFATLVNEMSGGRLKIRAFTRRAMLVSALEVFDAVSRGTAEMGHGAPYYWKGKVPAAQFFCALPFGPNAQEMNAGRTVAAACSWEEVYKPFGVLPMACGATGVQTAGWFNKEINSVEDFQGLKMRTPGLGGEVLTKMGGTVVNMPAGEIFTALQTGAIDATEWIGPYNNGPRPAQGVQVLLHARLAGAERHLRAGRQSQGLGNPAG